MYQEIKEVRFELGSLTASAAGLFDRFSSHSVNGELVSATFLANSYTETGSLLLFPSGLQNSGINLGGLFIRVRAGSSNQTFYPATYTHDNQLVIGSDTADTAREKFVINEPLRIVGSGLGASTSGLGVIVRYR